MNTALTIAGSDSSGGAGIQADLKTFAMNGVYGMSVITSVTAQNTRGVYDIFDLPPNAVTAQADAVFSDIFPDSVKIGMVSSAQTISAIADFLKKYNAQNVVLDTVMVSTSGCPLIKSDAISSLTKQLFPLARIITPNIYEAQILSGFNIDNENDMEKAAKNIFEKYGVCVFLKGGHLTDTSNDLLYNGKIEWFNGERISNPNTHGTGCTLSSAIAANLANGCDIRQSVKKAKEYIAEALKDMMNLGKGSGPLNHIYKIHPSRNHSDI